MQRNTLFLSFLWVVALVHFGGCGPHWRVGVWRETSTAVATPAACSDCGQVSCHGGCTGHAFTTWYPGKHLFRGFHHVCGLFTCSGCGGNYWGCGGCNACSGGVWNPFDGGVSVENQLEPIPAPTNKASSAGETKPPAAGNGG